MNKPIEAIYPLSPTQEGILFHALYAPQSGVYFQHLSYTLRGRLDEAAFKLAWERIVERHAVLRTAFSWERRTQPLQIVHKQVPLNWESLDWCAHSAAEQQAQLNAFLFADRARGFRLDRPPLSRFALIRLAPDSYQFVWSFHHLLLDGWSLALVLKEVMALYAALAGGQDLRLGPVRPYREYVAWLNRPDAASSEAFWKDWLKGFTAPTALGIDRAPGSLPDQEAVYAEVHLQLPTATTETLKAIAREHQLTLNTLVQGVWALLVSRYSRTEDVVFGATVSGRTSALTGMDSMVGLFINSLPVRVQVSPESHFLPWLKALQTRQFELQQHQHTPLVQIQGWSELPRGQGLFDSILVFENYPVDDSLKALWQQGGSLEVSDIYPSPERTNYPLSVTAFLGTQLEMRIFYECHRFSSVAIARLAGHLQTLLTGVATDPHRSLALLPMLSEPELTEHRNRNRAATDFPPPACLHRLFEAQVLRSPDALAVLYQNETLSYSQLNRRANQLAHHLQNLGVGPEVPVGLCLQRSPNILVAILATLKAGGAYLPLDPTYPEERLAFLLGDARPPVLISDQTEKPAGYEGHWVSLLVDSEAISQQRDDNPTSAAAPDNLAYIIYTSGSTGTPKGVLVTHANVCRLFTATQPLFHFNHTDVWTLFHSFAFDFSVWEIWGALLHGGKLIVVPYLVSRSPERFYELLLAAQVSVLSQTPSAFRQLIAVEAQKDRDLALRTVVFGGEALQSASLLPWFKRHGDKPQLVNMYGITETTVHVTYSPLSAAATDPGLGVPLADLQLYLLDRQLQPVPVGVVGEICVGGAGVARGYLDRAELTAERFVPNPFDQAGGGRLYRSGDLGRYRSNGQLEYLGRADQQVKLRGFRIEPGEIEAALLSHPAIREAAVLVETGGDGEGRLVAYLVVGGESPLTADLLYGYLKQKLPLYMVPGAFVVLEKLPLSANGKLDRKAVLGLGTGLVPGAGREARTPSEAVLAGIWSEVLGVAVGVSDDFFALGGHSLSATRLISRVREVFQVDLPLRAIFEGASTVAQMAHTLEQLEFERADPEVLARMLRELEQLSDQEVLLLMNEEIAA